MIRHLILAAPLALGLVSAQALAAGKTPPPEYATYVAAVRKADAIPDSLQRCLAYPDLPGNQWAPGVARARCVMFNTPPMFTLDTLEKALAQPEGAKAVDAKFAALLDAHYTVPDQREQIFLVFKIFDDKDRDKAERIARAWLAASPGSAFAQAALGKALAARGWEARGTKFARDTPAEDLRRMELYFVDAAKQYSAALEANPKLYPACIGLMSIGRQSSDPVQAWATKTCMAVDPASYFVVEEMMTAAEPRWGGSTETMRNVAAYAQARVKDNPVLAVFAFNHAFYGIDGAADEDAQALSVLEPAAVLVPNAAYLRKVGGAYLRKDDYWKSFVYLSQALRFMPDYAQESRWRAYVLFKLGESQWARTDAERAVALDPVDYRAQHLLGDILHNTIGPEAARPYYARTMDDPELRERAFVSYCWSYVDAKQLKDAAGCVDSLLKEFPGNGEGWRLRMMLLGPDAPETTDAMKRFLATHDPNRWPDHKAIAERVRTLLADQERMASTSDDFKARAARATALELTQEGRDYLKQFMPKTNEAFGKVLGVCLTAGNTGAKSFRAVMDVLANGKIANVEVTPVDALSSCYAKRAVEMVTAPRPPAKFTETGFPMVIDTSWK